MGEEKRRPGRPRVRPLPDPNEPKRGRGRPRTRPLPDPDAPKRSRGRQFKEEGVRRTHIGLYITAEQEEWLKEMKAMTGKSCGEIVDDIVKRYAHGE